MIRWFVVAESKKQPLSLSRHLAALLRFALHTTTGTMALPDQTPRKRSAARITHLHS